MLRVFFFKFFVSRNRNDYRVMYVRQFKINHVDTKTIITIAMFSLQIFYTYCFFFLLSFFALFDSAHTRIEYARCMQYSKKKNNKIVSKCFTQVCFSRFSSLKISAKFLIYLIQIFFSIFFLFSLRSRSITIRMPRANKKNQQYVICVVCSLLMFKYVM